jgi:endo-1,4-beta-mannosidase
VLPFIVKVYKLNKHQRIPKEQSKKGTIQRNWQHRIHNTKKNKAKHKTICVGYHCTHTKTNNVNKTCTLIQTSGGKCEQNNRNGHHNVERRT